MTRSAAVFCGTLRPDRVEPDPVRGPFFSGPGSRCPWVSGGTHAARMRRLSANVVLQFGVRTTADRVTLEAMMEVHEQMLQPRIADVRGVRDALESGGHRPVRGGRGVRHTHLSRTALQLVAPRRGILVADESPASMNDRLAAEGIPADEERRRVFRELVVTTPGLGRWISGVILHDETFHQSGRDGSRLITAAMRNGVIPGIKVDTGTKSLARADGETITEGLDGLRERLAEYVSMGARFAEWRAVFRIGGRSPSGLCLSANAHAFARYAALCQEAGVVPLVAPEVLLDGEHGIDRCAEVTAECLRVVFSALRDQGVNLRGIVLQPNMVTPGGACPERADVDAVADATLTCLRGVVPAAVPGVAFCSGGQSDEAATRHLDAMNRRPGRPWELTFSLGEALLGPTLSTWAGEDWNVEAAQSVLVHRARRSAAARSGEYAPAVEEAAARP
jgi:fructose-bisphosphate aldolase, class I